MENSYNINKACTDVRFECCSLVYVCSVVVVGVILYNAKNVFMSFDI